MLLGNGHGIIEHPRQKWLREGATNLGYPYIASSGCLGYNFFLRSLIYQSCVICMVSLLLRT